MSYKIAYLLSAKHLSKIFSYLHQLQVNFLIWQPDKLSIILGASNEPDNSLIIENVIKDTVSVYKRHTGGEAVIISNKTLIISCIKIAGN